MLGEGVSVAGYCVQASLGSTCLVCFWVYLLGSSGVVKVELAPWSGGDVGHRGVTQGGQQLRPLAEEVVEESGGPSPGSSWLERTRNFFLWCCRCCNECKK